MYKLFTLSSLASCYYCNISALLKSPKKEPMEALWRLEDKWKLSTPQALLLLVCTALTIVGLCATAMLKKKRIQGRQLDDEEPSVTDTMSIKWSESESGWASIKKALMGTMRWSRAGKWEETDNGGWKETPPPPPLLVGGGCELGVGWQSHNSVSPVWQRPILMGERCELPRFSGLILYDEGGRPLDHSSGVTHQEKTATVVTTLRDLL